MHSCSSMGYLVRSMSHATVEVILETRLSRDNRMSGTNTLPMCFFSKFNTFDISHQTFRKGNHGLVWYKRDLFDHGAPCVDCLKVRFKHLNVYLPSHCGSSRADCPLAERLAVQILHHPGPSLCPFARHLTPNCFTHRCVSL